MDIKILGSSSAGNSYILSDGQTNIMLDCGLPIQEILEKTNFFETRIDACLISHSHGDHALSAEKLMRRAIDCYMSKDTAKSLNIDKELMLSRAVYMEHGREFKVGTFLIRPLEMAHDVPCLGFLIYSEALKETLFFATDTSFIRYMLPAVDYIMIEANYDMAIVNSRLQAGDNAMAIKQRLVKSHMSIDATIGWLTTTNLCRCKRIYLMHLSDGNADAVDFKKRVMEATGIPVTVCK